MTIKIDQDTDQWHDFVQKYNHHFIHNRIFTFTNLMWQIIMNRHHHHETVIFHPWDNKEGSGFQIALVTKGKAGVAPLGVEFPPEMTYTDCTEICDEINHLLFGIDEDEVNDLIYQSQKLPGGMKHDKDINDAIMEITGQEKLKNYDPDKDPDRLTDEG